MKAICKPHAGLRPEISELATASLLPSYIGSPWLRSTYENPAREIDIIGVSAFEIPISVIQGNALIPSQFLKRAF